MLVDVVVAKKSESLSEAYERRRAMYESRSCCDYSLRVAVTSWSPAVQQDMQRLVTDKGQRILPHNSTVPKDSVDDLWGTWPNLE